MTKYRISYLRSTGDGAVKRESETLVFSTRRDAVEYAMGLTEVRGEPVQQVQVDRA